MLQEIAPARMATFNKLVQANVQAAIILVKLAQESMHVYLVMQPGIDNPLLIQLVVIAIALLVSTMLVIKLVLNAPTNASLAIAQVVV